MYVNVVAANATGGAAAYEIRNPRTGAVVNFDNDIDFSLQPQMHFAAIGRVYFNNT